MSERRSAAKIQMAQSTLTAASTLADLAWDDDWVVRVAVAENPATPTSVLEDVASRGEGMAQATAQRVLELRRGRSRGFGHGR